MAHAPSRPRRVERVALVPAPVENTVEPIAEPSNAAPSDVPPSGEVMRAQAEPAEEITPPIETITAPIEAIVAEPPTVALAITEPTIAPSNDEPTIERGPTPPPPPAPVMSLPRRGVLRKRSSIDRVSSDRAPSDVAKAEQAPSAPAIEEPTAPIVEVEQSTPAEHAAPMTPVAPIAQAEPELLAAPEVAPARVAPMRRVPMQREPMQREPMQREPIQREPIRAPRVASARDLEPVDDDLVDETAALRVVASAEWRNHAQDLDAAKGPKPVAVIEKLFTTRYLPLIGAAARGEIDAPIKGVVETFRTNFEHSYREAYSALRVTGKRPPMVFDAPEIAGRIGRLNGARAVKLFLVDALRFDLGERVAQLLAERLTGRAVCVERMVMWAALPTTTPTQMALLSRGAEGLRDAGPSSEPDVEITRGRAVGTVRRERVGAREVMKLDLVEARVRTPGPAYSERMDAIAEEVVQITVRYIETLPPRTLLFLFGDHGFRLSGSADGRTTGPASQGGVSPEEVLVPGQAWLIGGVH